jgi:hypothetical protein
MNSDDIVYPRPIELMLDAKQKKKLVESDRKLIRETILKLQPNAEFVISYCKKMTKNVERFTISWHTHNEFNRATGRYYKPPILEENTIKAMRLLVLHLPVFFV